MAKQFFDKSLLLILQTPDYLEYLSYSSFVKCCSLRFLSLQAHTREPLPEPMTARLYNGMRSIDLPGKSSGLSEQIAKEQFVIFMSNLLKGNADEKISIIMRMISKTGGPLKGKQIQEVKEQLNVCWGDSKRAGL